MCDTPSAPSAPVDLAGIGWDDAWAGLAATSPAGDPPGRVVRVDRGLASVLTGTGLVRAGLGVDVLEQVAADRTAAPVTGDWVQVRTWPDDRVTVERVLSRRTSLGRAGAGERSETQVLATNATAVAVVVGALPDPGPAKVERLLAVAAASGARAMLVLAKADLVTDADDLVAELEAGAPGVEMFPASTVSRVGLARLRAVAGATGTLALVGSSGAGKSSLVNALVGAPVLPTRQIRADGRGRHTSVHRELVPLPGGGCVIDTPGLRGVGLAGTEQGVTAVFSDVAALAASCRFADCAHDREPDCAVTAAVDRGVLPVRRLDAWRRMQRELSRMARRRDDRLRAHSARRSTRVPAADRPHGPRRAR